MAALFLRIAVAGLPCIVQDKNSLIALNGRSISGRCAASAVACSAASSGITVSQRRMPMHRANADAPAKAITVAMSDIGARAGIKQSVMSQHYHRLQEQQRIQQIGSVNWAHPTALSDAADRTGVDQRSVELPRCEADSAVRVLRPERNSPVVRKVGDVGVGAYGSNDYLARRGVPESSMTHDLIGFVSHNAAATDAHVRLGLPQLPIPPLSIWRAVHREIRGHPAIRAVYDLLGARVWPRSLLRKDPTPSIEASC